MQIQLNRTYQMRYPAFRMGKPRKAKQSHPFKNTAGTSE
jgi:hypothetical protein